MSLRPHTQRAVTWLCLVLVALLTMVPATGAIVCLGHDGHVGFATGVSAEVGACPCDHVSERRLDAKVDVAEATEDSHAPCVDLAIDPPDIVNDSGFAAKAPGDVSHDDGLSAGSPIWAPDVHAGFVNIAKRVWWAADRAVPRPRQQLEHRRVVVLLI